MDRSFEIQQLKVFQEMALKGLIFRRYKPVHWSPSSRTALAEAELEYKDDHQSTAAYIKFPITSIPKEKSVPSNLFALIWTTTPWTLPANRAIAFSRDLEYTIVRSGGDRFIVAKSRLPHISKVCFGDNPIEVVVDSIMGQELDGAKYVNVLRGKESESQPFIHADFVSADSGSGLVHCAPGHGMDDYDVCTKLGIEAVAPVDDSGCFTSAALPEEPSILEGKSVLRDGNREVLKILGDKVLATHKYKHKYPYDWRTKLPVIIRATEQWFADVRSIKEAALQRLNDVQFIPEAGRSRLESFVKGRSEWCISRQRAWGVPIPALYDEQGKAVLTNEIVAHIISVIDEKGIDAWWTDAADDPAWVAPGLEGKYRRGRDTMDVWFDSGTSWTQATQQADIYVEGTDQHRGWFQSSLLTHTSVSSSEGPPFKTLITHGFTLDQDGRKMSKSIGNVIAPSQIMDGSLLPAPTGKKKHGDPALGPDALRLWAASSDYTRDVVIGQPVLLSNRIALLKYRMILKMLLGSMHQSARDSDVKKVDQMALAQLEDVMGEVAAAYDRFEFHKGISAINRWINSDVSAFYLEAAKDRLYCADGGGVLEEIFQGLLRMLTPIAPSLVEEAWSHRPEWMNQYDMVHPFHQKVSEPLSSRTIEIPPTIRDDLPWILKANAAVKAAQEEARASKLIGGSLESSLILLLPSEKAPELFQGYKDELENIFGVSSVEINGEVEGAWKFSAEFDTPGGKGVAWIVPARDAKCPRCWRYKAPAEDQLCARCEDTVSLL